jgi:translation initiation factor 3 subunit A
MDTDSLRRLQVIQLDKERGELHEKLRVTGKRIDHFERALRREEIPLLNDDYDAQLAQESRVYEQNRQQKLALAAARHKESLNLKKRLQRILPDYQDYRSTIKQNRFEEFETRRKEAQNALEAEKARKLTAYHKYQEDERRKDEEREREEELERERQHKEEEQEMEREEAARQAEAEKIRIREEERRYFPIALGAKVQMTDCVVGNKTKLWRNKSNVNGKRKKKSRVSGKKHPSVRLPRLD